MSDKRAQSGPKPASRGAYGLKIDGLESVERLLVEAQPDWPALSVDWFEDSTLAAGAVEPLRGSTVRFTEKGAVIEVGAACVIDVIRAGAHATIRARAVAGGTALVHPYLGAAASVVACWLGRESFHGGAFISGGEAWGVLGSRTAGKSSLLAWLHREGRQIIADDLLVLDGLDVFAAPRTLDLRRETAEHLELGEPLGWVGARERWRIELAPVPPSVRLAGWISLAWGETVELVPLRGRERLSRLGAQLTIGEFPTHAAALMELAALPSFELRRPMDWEGFDAAGNALLGGLP